MPRLLEERMITAEEVSAAIPCGDLISTSPLPRVRMTRQPPTQVPAAIAMAQAIFTHSGMACRLVQLPYATSARVITPMVF
jgi:hypothetical protein